MFAQDIVVIDYETTGPSVRHGDEPIQLGAVRLDRVTLREVAAFTSFIQPTEEARMTEEAFAVHRTHLSVLQDAPAPKAVVKAFEAALLLPAEQSLPEKSIILAAHNATFDRQFHERLLERAGVSATRHGYHYLCTWSTAIALNGLLDLGLPSSVSLSSLCAFLGITRPEPHDALTDARATGACLRELFGLSRAVRRCP